MDRYVELYPYESAQLHLTATPESASLQGAKWAVNYGEDVISLTDSGLVTAKKAGVGVVRVEIAGQTLYCTVSVNSFMLNRPNRSTFYVGEKVQYTLTPAPKKAARWSSSAADVASVDENGLVTMQKKGKAFIYTKIAGKTFKTKVIVIKQTLSQKEAEAFIGERVKLQVIGAVKGEPVKWESADRKIAGVSKKGVVAARRAGKTTITATYAGRKLTCKITVKAPVISNVPFRIYAGEKCRLNVHGLASPITYGSENSKIAVVSKNGILKGKRAGKTTVYAESNGQKATVNVTVLPCPVLNVEFMQFRWTDRTKADFDIAVKNYTDKTIRKVTFDVWFYPQTMTLKQVNAAGARNQQRFVLRENIKSNAAAYLYREGITLPQGTGYLKIGRITVEFADGSTKTLSKQYVLDLSLLREWVPGLQVASLL